MQDKTRQDKAIQYRTRQVNTHIIQTKTRQAIIDKTRQDEISTMQDTGRPDKSRQRQDKSRQRQDKPRQDKPT